MVKGRLDPELVEVGPLISNDINVRVSVLNDLIGFFKGLKAQTHTGERVDS